MVRSIRHLLSGLLLLLMPCCLNDNSLARGGTANVDVNLAVRKLRTGTAKEKETAVRALEQIPLLPPEAVGALISELGNPVFGHLAVNGTPVIPEVPPIRVLKRHREAIPELQRALISSNAQVRGFAAFILGQMHDNAAVPQLQQLIRLELEQMRRSPDEAHASAQSVMNAAVDAYAQIDARNGVEWLLPLSVDRSGPDVRLSACEALRRIIVTGPPYCSVAEMKSGQCGRIWKNWWEKNKDVIGAEAFRFSTPPNQSRRPASQ